MPNGTYGGVRGRKTKVGRKLFRFPPTRFLLPGQLKSPDVLSHWHGILLECCDAVCIIFEGVYLEIRLCRRII